jgi:hypothetical protein
LNIYTINHITHNVHFALNTLLSNLHALTHLIFTKGLWADIVGNSILQRKRLRYKKVSLTRSENQGTAWISRPAFRFRALPRNQPTKFLRTFANVLFRQILQTNAISAHEGHDQLQLCKALSCRIGHLFPQEKWST